MVQLVETRDVAPPPFDQVRQRLEQVVQGKKFRVYMDELMRSARIEKFDQTAAAPPAAPAGAAAPAAPGAPAASAPAAAPPAPTPSPAPTK